jgi:hypothetical protein
MIAPGGSLLGSSSPVSYMRVLQKSQQLNLDVRIFLQGHIPRSTGGDALT